MKCFVAFLGILAFALSASATAPQKVCNNNGTCEGWEKKIPDCTDCDTDPEAPPPQWTWTVEIPADGSNLHGEPAGDIYTHGCADGGCVDVKVTRENANSYRFDFVIENGAGRYVGLQDITLNEIVFGDDPGAGHLPTIGCDNAPNPCCEYPYPDPASCQNECTSRFQNFLHRQDLHPACEYEYFYLSITVDRDIESVKTDDGEVQTQGYVWFKMSSTDVILENWDDAFHNMSARPSTSSIPLTISRIDNYSWLIQGDLDYLGESDGDYMRYHEIYNGKFRGKKSEYKVPIFAKGEFRFQTIWERHPIEQ